MTSSLVSVPAPASDFPRLSAGDPDPDRGADPIELSARDYPRVTAALDFLGDHWRDAPSYAEAAAVAGLSPHHFHRVFSRWVGLSPKRYVGALAHAAARDALAAGDSVEGAAFEAGLSGPSRLHDLFIAHEAVTPGDARRRGEGLAFTWGAAPTPFGDGVFLIAPRGLAGLAFADPDVAGGFADLAGRFPGADFTRDDRAAADWSARVFAGRDRPVPLALYGTAWQRQVWRALLAIPPGETTSYAAVAAAAGKPGAARAAGAAVGRNPISWVVPCHRVLATDGRLTGYHWGLSRKRAMLAFEAAWAER